MRKTKQNEKIRSTSLRDFIAEGVRQAYHGEDIPCVPTSLRILGQLFDIEISGDVYTACWGLNGAGLYGAQCGLVEGALMILSMLCHRYKMDTDGISRVCSNFASDFEDRFGSLLCRELRPEGFTNDQPPHLCEERTVAAIVFAAEFIEDVFKIKPSF